VKYPLIDVGLVIFPNPDFDNVAQNDHYVLEGSHPVFDCHVHVETVTAVLLAVQQRWGKCCPGVSREDPSVPAWAWDSSRVRLNPASDSDDSTTP
jgi:hypothetical protein